MPVKGGGKGGNMPVLIQVKVKDGDVYCKDDPAHIKYSEETSIEWHCNAGEFELEFVGGSPFVSGETILKSENRKVKAEVKPPNDKFDTYVYYVTLILESSTRKPVKQITVDPGLIIKP
jgi:hypothetical protein